MIETRDESEESEEEEVEEEDVFQEPNQPPASFNLESLKEYLTGCFIDPLFPKHLLLIYSYKLGNKEQFRAKEVVNGTEK